MSVEVDKRGAALHVLLARPDKRNAFDGDMLSALEAAIERANTDPDCRVLVLAGQGQAFCAGADLRWLAMQGASGRQGNVDSARRMGGIFHQLSACRVPTIARVQGPAMGGGVGLAAACDLVVAGQGAYFTLSEVRLGLVPAVISPFIVRRVGPPRARAMFMLGRRILATEAERIGLADIVVRGETQQVIEAALDVTIRELCATLYKGGPDAQALCKRLVDAVAFRDPADVLDLTAEMIADTRATAEAAEGIAAFLGKRPASWVPVDPGAEDAS